MSKHQPVPNAELLSEIAKSKATYCSFLEPYNIHFDLPIDDLSEITPELIQQAKERKAHKETFRLHKEARAAGYRRTSPQFKAGDRTADDYSDSDIVFRLNTTDHVPIPEDERNRKGKTFLSDLPFPPFKQYTVDNTGKPQETGRSHWQGSFDAGEFCQTQGKMTDQLCRLIMRMVDRFGTKGNWRGYTYNDEMKGAALLTLVRNALKFDETKSANPFAYYTTSMNRDFIKVLRAEKQQQFTKDEILSSAGLKTSHAYQNREAG